MASTAYQLHLKLYLFADILLRTCPATVSAYICDIAGWCEILKDAAAEAVFAIVTVTIPPLPDPGLSSRTK